jgi:hypothetical protein
VLGVYVSLKPPDPRHHKNVRYRIGVLCAVGTVATYYNQHQLDEAQWTLGENIATIGKDVSGIRKGTQRLPSLQVIQRLWVKDSFPPARQRLNLYIQNVGDATAKKVRTAALIVQAPNGTLGEEIAFKTLTDSLPKSDSVAHQQGFDTGINARLFITDRGLS